MKKSKNRIQIDLGLNDTFKFYCEKTGNPHKLQRWDFNVILKDFFNIIVDKMIYENAEMTMPNHLGNLRISKRLVKPRLKPDGSLDKGKLIVDYKASRELWSQLYPGVGVDDLFKVKNKPIIYNQNKHTNGYVCAWNWDKRTCLLPFRGVYKFDMCRANDRKLAKALKNTELKLNYYVMN